MVRRSCGSARRWHAFSASAGLLAEGATLEVLRWGFGSLRPVLILLPVHRVFLPHRLLFLALILVFLVAFVSHPVVSFLLDVVVRVNQARWQLCALAYNLGNFLRRLALPKPIRHWSLTTLREKLIKIGAKVTRHAKYVTFQLAKVAVTRNLFAAILARIARLAIPPSVVGPIRVQERQTGQQGLVPGGCPAPQPAERRWRP